MAQFKWKAERLSVIYNKHNNTVSHTNPTQNWVVEHEVAIINDLRYFV